MIVHELQTVFVHIPKTAGVSVVHALLTSVLGQETTGPVKKLPRQVKERFSLQGPQKHKIAKEYIPTDITQQQWNAYYKFAFVRNPWARAVSEYHWRMSLKQKDHPFGDFDEFLKYCETRIRTRKRDLYLPHGLPQFEFITDTKGKIILDDVFKLEEITQAISVIENKLNVTLYLRKHNTSSHKHYREYYTDRTKQLVGNMYEQDIETFGYEF